MLIYTKNLRGRPVCRILLVVMKIKQTVKVLLVVLGLTLTALAAVIPTAGVASADCDPANQSCCGGVQTSLITCSETGGAGVEQTGVWGLLLIILNILTAGIGLAAVAGIVYASILYTSAGGSQEQIKKALTTIANIVIGVVAYAGMYALLNFLIPGGLFN